jgi:hypothetical protein
LDQRAVEAPSSAERSTVLMLPHSLAIAARAPFTALVDRGLVRF